MLTEPCRYINDPRTPLRTGVPAHYFVSFLVFQSPQRGIERAASFAVVLLLFFGPSSQCRIQCVYVVFPEHTHSLQQPYLSICHCILIIEHILNVSKETKIRNHRYNQVRDQTQDSTQESDKTHNKTSQTRQQRG